MINKSKFKVFGMVLMMGVLVFVMAACGSSGVSEDLPIGDDNGDDLAIVGVDYDLASNMEFLVGTSEAEIIAELPGTITVNYDDGNSEDVDLDWAASGNFDSQVEGKYTFIGSYTVPGFDLDPVEVEVEIVDLTVIEVTGDIDEDTIWETGYLYRVLNDIDINADLTIEPGVIVEFDDETGMELTGNNIINAGNVGQAAVADNNDDLIRLTAVNETLGWDGIVIDSSHPDNAMDNVLIEHVTGNPALTVAGGADDGAHLTLTNSRIENNDEYGLMLEGRGSTFTDSANNIYRENYVPVYLTENNMQFMDSDSDFEGNANDYIMVAEGHATRDVYGDQLIRPLNVPYRIEDEFRFADGEIEVIGGTEFEFMEDAGFRFEEDSQVRIGIQDPEAGREGGDQVVFTADITQVGQEGRWNGIRIESSHPDNIIQNSLIDYGGNSNNENAALFIEDGAYVRLTNTVISNSEADGIFLRRNASDIDMSGVYITDNKGAPVRLRPGNIQNISSNNQFTGNDKDYIDVQNPGTDDGLDSNQTWQDLGVPYRFDLSISIEDDVKLEIQAGTELQFRNGRRMTIQDSAELTAKGTESAPIIFTSSDDTNDWVGLMLRTERDNRLEHVRIEDGGSDRNVSFNEPAALEIGGGSSGTGTVQLDSVEINNSTGLGIYVRVKNGSSINGYDNAVDFGANYDSYGISFSNNTNDDFYFD